MIAPRLILPSVWRNHTNATDFWWNIMTNHMSLLDILNTTVSECGGKRRGGQQAQDKSLGEREGMHDWLVGVILFGKSGQLTSSSTEANEEKRNELNA